MRIPTLIVIVNPIIHSHAGSYVGMVTQDYITYTMLSYTSLLHFLKYVGMKKTSGDIYIKVGFITFAKLNARGEAECS